MQPRVVKLEAAFAGLGDPWTPATIGELNDHVAHVARYEGERDWQTHNEADVLLVVQSGRLRVDLRDGSTLEVNAGECVIIPKRTEHKTAALEPSNVFVVEPKASHESGAAKPETVMAWDASDSKTGVEPAKPAGNAVDAEAATTPSQAPQLQPADLPETPSPATPVPASPAGGASGKPVTSFHGAVPSMASTPAATRSKWRVIGVALVVALMAVGIWVYTFIERQLEHQVATQLQTILNANVEAMQQWREARIASLQGVLAETDVHDACVALLRYKERDRPTADELWARPEMDFLHKEFSPKRLAAMQFELWALSLHDGTIVAAPVKNFLETPGLANEQQRLLFNRLLQRKTALSIPYLAQATETKTAVAGDIAQVASVTIYGRDGRPLGVLLGLINVAKDFTRILNAARPGDTGETYAVDELGRMLNQSRFHDDLERIGLLLPGTTSILNLEIRDPGRDLTGGGRTTNPHEGMPLTRMARELTAERDGVDASGYRDYRGVTVVGAWRWLDDAGFGIATEQDVSEAYAPLTVLRITFASLFFLFALASGGAFIASRYAVRFQHGAAVAMAKMAQLGQYRLEKKLGAGGFGDVYLAHHALLRRPCALKMLRADRNSPTDIQRFELEVQQTALLTHPNTVQIYDYGHDAGGTFYYAMEMLPGLSLHDLIADYGPISAGRCIHLLRQMCGSLGEAHDRGLIHRDIKPGNIMLIDRAGIADWVKVLDFGLVKKTDSADPAMTQEGFTVGTPHFLSPESIKSPEDLDARTDIYALGITCYFLLTGDYPFTKQPIGALLAQHLAEAPEPPSQRSGRALPQDFENLILRCLAKDRDDRPKDASALAAALDALADAHTWTDDHARDWWRSHGPDALANAAADDESAPPSIALDLSDRG